MATQTETLQVTGIRCEKCVHRLAGALQGQDGLEYANAVSGDGQQATRPVPPARQRAALHPQ